MMIDMKYFNVYYFCHLANNSMGQFDYASTNAEFTEGFFAVEPQDFPKESVLREHVKRIVKIKSKSPKSHLYLLFQFSPL